MSTVGACAYSSVMADPAYRAARQAESRDIEKPNSDASSSSNPSPASADRLTLSAEAQELSQQVDVDNDNEKAEAGGPAQPIALEVFENTSTATVPNQNRLVTKYEEIARLR